MNKSGTYYLLRHRLVFFAILLFSVVGCVDEIELELKNRENIVIVDGTIGDLLKEYQINVKYSAALGRSAEYVNEPVLGANVKVIDNNGGTYLFEERKPGEFHHEMQGIPGRSYHVEVTLDDGQIIKSDPTMLRTAPEIDSLDVEVYEKSLITGGGLLITDKTAQLYLTTEFENLDEAQYFRWTVDGEFEFKENVPPPGFSKSCYVPDRVGNNYLSVINTDDIEGNKIRNEIIFETEYDHKFGFNYCFHVNQLSMSRQEYEYWQTVNDIINIDGSLFDPPPGRVNGNLHYEGDSEKIVLGYFTVAGISSKKVFANITSTGSSVEPHCYPYRPRSQNPPECVDCEILRNSTAVKPDYWP